MQNAINSYFADNDKPTMCGLSLHLGFSGRESLNDYGGYSPEFFALIKSAKHKVEASYEKFLLSQSVTGAIFALKNMGWADRQEINQNITGKVGLFDAIRGLEIEQNKLEQTARNPLLEAALSDKDTDTADISSSSGQSGVIEAKNE
jgi:hypothetical protein